MRRKVRVKEMAELLGVSIHTIRNRTQKRIIPYYKVGRVILFDPEAVEAALKEYERTPRGRMRRR
jgi:excisionase family DNA binding protein